MTRIGVQGDAQGVKLPPTVFVEFYSRLHEKSTSVSMLFDNTWLCHGARQVDTISWSKRFFQSSQSAVKGEAFFTRFINRLILLSPGECQKLLCTAMLLSRREAFRRCIEGGKVRTLQSLLGVATVAAILKSTSIYDSPVGSSDWRIDSLLGEAFSQIENVCEVNRRMVTQVIKIALPKGLPVIQSSSSESNLEKLLREACGWHPELIWLFG